MRVISASGTVASVQAGSSRWRRLRGSSRGCPVSSASITLMPVTMRRLKVRGGIWPPIGSQPRMPPNSSSSIRPSQKIGIDTPSRLPVSTRVIEPGIGPQRGHHAERYADERGDRQRRKRELQGDRKRGQHVVEGRMVGLQRDAEIAVQRPGGEARVLDPDRPVDAELRAQARQRLRRGVIAQQHLRDVAGQDVHQQEDDNADADDDQQKLPKPSCRSSRSFSSVHAERLAGDPAGVVGRRGTGRRWRCPPALPSRRSAMRSIRRRWPSSPYDCHCFSLLGLLRTKPGATLFTVMPNGPSSWASWRVRPISPALAEA